VPALLAGRRVQVALGADWLDVRHDGVLVARHTRSLHKGSEDLVLDHYLEVLTHRPGALAGATALVSARATGVFTDEHQRFWDTARRKAGDRDGTKALIGVLLLHRTLPAEAVPAGIDAAVAAGRCDPDLVAVEARRHAPAARRIGVVWATCRGRRGRTAAYVTALFDLHLRHHHGRLLDHPSPCYPEMQFLP